MLCVQVVKNGGTDKKQRKKIFFLVLHFLKIFRLVQTPLISFACCEFVHLRKGSSEQTKAIINILDRVASLIADHCQCNSTTWLNRPI